MTDVTTEFDAWRAENNPTPRTTTIFGEQVAIPTAIPLELSLRIDDADTEDTALLAELVAEMYGPGELDRWVKARCSTYEFAVLLAWGSAQANGQDISFDRAAEIVKERREGKAPGNRAQRRAANKRKRR